MSCLASRLCVFGMVERWVDAVPTDDLKLKGFNHPVLAMEILRWREEVGNVLEATAAAAAKAADVAPRHLTPLGPRP